jgi:hypothetical protein
VSSVKYELGFYIPEDDMPLNHRRETLKSYRLYIGSVSSNPYRIRDVCERLSAVLFYKFYKVCSPRHEAIPGLRAGWGTLHVNTLTL